MSQKMPMVALFILVLAVVTGFVFISSKNSADNSLTSPVDTPTEESVLDTNQTPAEEVIPVVVYLQNKEAAMVSDCGITYPKAIDIPRTTAVADASLAFLFTEELAQYGTYQSVVVNDGVAKVTIVNQADPTGMWISSMSSCESSHLFSVIEDTLTQYSAITAVELYSPTDKIDF